MVEGNRDAELDIAPDRQDLREPYNRTQNPSFPYRSHLQWLRALYALVFSVLLIIFKGWKSFVPPFDPQDFIASYIAVSGSSGYVFGKCTLTCFRL